MGHLGTQLGQSWSYLGAVLGHFEELQNQVSGCLGPSWSHLGLPGTILGPNWGHLGAVLGHLGAVLGHLEELHNQVSGCLGPSWTILGHLRAQLVLFFGYLAYFIGAFLVPSVIQFTKKRPGQKCGFPTVKLHFFSGKVP